MSLSIVELLAVIFGLVAVYFNTREIVWAWPTGIVGVILSAILFYEVKLYADLSLHVVYVVLGFYGWYEWLYGGKHQSALRVSTSSSVEIMVLLVVGAAGSGIIGFLFNRYTDADLAYWDGFTTSFSLVGQYWLAKKKLENWLLWIVVDVVASGIYIYKGLYLLALLYFLYLGLAVYGYQQWRKALT